MRSKARDIDVLLRLRGWEADAIRRELGRFQEREAALLREDLMLDQQLEIEKDVARKNMMLSGDFFSGYFEFYRIRKDELAILISAVRAEIVRVREMLLAAFRRKKALEEVQKEYARNEKIEEGRKEQAYLDEVSMADRNFLPHTQ